ncbi:MAG: glutamate 5-kinase [Lachnospiraceae bacterium]|nr:glutamate 5-kinase [Lachnospiraceae bacterium]
MYKRVVIKIGSNSLTHSETGHVDYVKIERLVREICDLKNRGMDVCLVSSGAIAVGRQAMGITTRPSKISRKQALASIGQASLMSIYQRFFSEYNQKAGQILMTRNTVIDNVSRKNAENTFEELFTMGVVPVVNENDTISTFEMQFGDNDTLSAIVTSLVHADLLILLSDIDGLFDEDPKKNKNAKLIKEVDEITDDLYKAASKVPGSDLGTGGMATKIKAASIAVRSGADMIITNGKDVSVIHRIMEGNNPGTVFHSHYDEDFYLADEV